MEEIIGATPNWPAAFQDNIDPNFRIGKPKVLDPILIKRTYLLLRETKNRRLEARKSKRIGQDTPPPTFRSWFPFPLWNSPKFKNCRPEVPRDTWRPITIIDAKPKPFWMEMRGMTQDEVDEYRIAHPDFFFTPMPERLLKKIREREEQAKGRKVIPAKDVLKRRIPRKPATVKQRPLPKIQNKAMTVARLVRRSRRSVKRISKMLPSSVYSVAITTCSESSPQPTKRTSEHKKPEDFVYVKRPNMIGPCRFPADSVVSVRDISRHSSSYQVIRNPLHNRREVCV